MRPNEVAPSSSYSSPNYGAEALAGILDQVGDQRLSNLEPTD